MKYSIKYTKGFRHLDSVDEIIITYKKKNIELLDFLKTVKQEQRIVVDASEIENLEDELEIFAAAVKVHRNLAIEISDHQAAILQDLSDMNIKYFFNTLVDSWDAFAGYCKIGVSDIYVVNELGFELKDLKRYGVNIRVFANVAQSSSKLKNEDNKLKNFFIRPEDVSLYEEYVDVIEFFGALDRQSILYEIYTQGQWLGDLSEIIIGLKTPIYSSCIVPYFGRNRIDCGKRCYKGKCNLCDIVLDVAKTLGEKGFKLEPERTKVKYDKLETNEKIAEIKSRTIKIDDDSISE